MFGKLKQKATAASQSVTAAVKTTGVSLVEAVSGAKYDSVEDNIGRLQRIADTILTGTMSEEMVKYKPLLETVRTTCQDAKTAAIGPDHFSKESDLKSFIKMSSMIIRLVAKLMRKLQMVLDSSKGEVAISRARSQSILNLQSKLEVDIFKAIDSGFVGSYEVHVACFIAGT